jgi:hypothetical protein
LAHISVPDLSRVRDRHAYTRLRLAIVGLLVVGLAAILPIILVILNMGQWIDIRATNDEKAAVARERAHDLANQLAAYKQEVATEYVRHGALERLESPIMDAIRGLGQRIDQAMIS